MAIMERRGVANDRCTLTAVLQNAGTTWAQAKKVIMTTTVVRASTYLIPSAF